MSFKIITGNLEKPKGDLIFLRASNQYILKDSKFFGSDKDYRIENNLINITPITEENKSSFVGKAGWGLVGSVALGPLGLLAGVLSGGNKKVMCCAFEMLPEYKFVAEIDVKAYHELNAIAQKNRDRGKVFPNSDIQSNVSKTIEVQSHADSTTPQLTIDDLPKLKKLLDEGVIEQSDFDAAKRKIFG